MVCAGAVRRAATSSKVTSAVMPSIATLCAKSSIRPLRQASCSRPAGTPPSSMPAPLAESVPPAPMPSKFEPASAAASDHHCAKSNSASRKSHAPLPSGSSVASARIFTPGPSTIKLIARSRGRDTVDVTDQCSAGPPGDKTSDQSPSSLPSMSGSFHEPGTDCAAPTWALRHSAMTESESRDIQLRLQSDRRVATQNAGTKT